MLTWNGMQLMAVDGVRAVEHRLDVGDLFGEVGGHRAGLGKGGRLSP
jgi:hypothetical protein